MPFKRIFLMLVVSLSSFIMSILTSLYPLAASSYQVPKVNIGWPIFFSLAGVMLLLPIFYEIRETFLIPQTL